MRCLSVCEWEIRVLREMSLGLREIPLFYWREPAAAVACWGINSSGMY